MKVNTLIIGAGRSGTTSVCNYLENHKQVCFSKIKEVHYFSVNDLHKRGEKYYHSFFPDFKDQNIIASADTYLMMDYDAIEKIKAYNPDMKIVIMLRNPVDRAYSSYNYSVNYGYHDAYPNFLDSIEKEKDIEHEPSIVQRNNLGHFYAGLYAKHIKEWAKVFPKDQLIIMKTESLKFNSPNFYKLLCNKLGIQFIYEQFIVKKEKKNANAKPRFKSIEQFLLNRENPIRKFIRWIVPSFLKRLIIHSNVVDKLHDINRKQADYDKLDNESYLKAMAYFEKDLAQLKVEFGIEF